MADEEVIQQDQALEIETQAREMGWRPKEEFRGAEDKWVDAATFVERGEHVLPIVKATAERLRGDLTRTNAELTKVTEALKASQETIQALERYHQDDVKQKVEQARTKLKAELKEAIKAGDVDAQTDLTVAIGELNSAEAARETEDGERKPERKPAPVKDYTNEPEFVAWRADNQWFGSDRAKTAIAYDITARLRSEGDKTVGRTFLDKVAVETSKEVARLGGGRPRGKVEASRSSGSAGGGGVNGKTYADLPADAKQACDSYERDLVGPDRRYKTADEWRQSYTKQFFTEV